MSDNDLAISVRGLSKSYTIAHNAPKHTTMAEAFVHTFKKNGRAKSEAETFWALKDIDFDIHKGDVVGVIGRNGAGKSTLLKILSRITEPTTGQIDVYGRIGSLLEVGTGFHPELTGRENIFMNGSILGMTRREISQQFDAIVDFSGTEKFLDTPVKRYSSGMYVRLAFAVAAHLEPEILIIDEVLAVGDADFQKKCLGKMQDVANHGRTVLFVSHNMGILQNLCRNAVLLRNGTVAAQGSVGEVVRAYLQSMESSGRSHVSERTDRRGRGDTRLCGIDVTTTGEIASSTLNTGEAARFVLHFTRILPGMTITFSLYDQHGHAVATFNSSIPSPEDTYTERLGAAFACEIDELPLTPGRYRMNVAIMMGSETLDHVEAACVIDVEPGQMRGRPVDIATGYGSIIIPHRWAFGVTDSVTAAIT